MRSAGLTCVDVVAITLVTGALATLVTAAGLSKGETANRVRCASNLKQIGQAIILYANENRGAYPRTRYKSDAAPVWGTPYASDDVTKLTFASGADAFVSDKDATKDQLAMRPAENDVTAALFLLLRTQDLVPEVFTCPSTTLKRFDYGGKDHAALDWNNFPGKEGIAKHLSYSYQNPYPSTAAIGSGFKLNNSLTAEFAVAADMNPGGDALLKATVKDVEGVKDDAELPANIRALNSHNHGGDGQNVLFGDGRVLFMNTPFVGVQRDNIYVANDANQWRKEKPAFAASPGDANDSILLPTAEAVGQLVTLRGDSPAVEPKAAMKKLLGDYHLDLPNGSAKLTIGDGTLRIKAGPTTTDLTFAVIDANGDGQVVAEVSGEEVPPFNITMTPQDGGVKFVGPGGPLNSEWHRGASTRPSHPATRPASPTTGPTTRGR